jgi:hypothetical protein
MIYIYTTNNTPSVHPTNFQKPIYSNDVKKQTTVSYHLQDRLYLFQTEDSVNVSVPHPKLSTLKELTQHSLTYFKKKLQ